MERQGLGEAMSSSSNPEASSAYVPSATGLLPGGQGM